MIAEHGAFLPRELSELTGLSQRRLRDWRRAGVLVPRYVDREPEPEDRPSHFYSFRDLVGLRLLAMLRARGIPLSELRQIQPWLLEHRASSWDELQLAIVDKRIVLLDGKVAPCPEGASDCVDLEPIARQTRADIDRSRQRKPGDIGRVARYRGVQQGDWVVAGTRMPTRSVMQMHEEGYDVPRIVREFPFLTAEDVRAAIAHETALGRTSAA